MAKKKETEKEETKTTKKGSTKSKSTKKEALKKLVEPTPEAAESLEKVGVKTKAITEPKEAPADNIEKEPVEVAEGEEAEITEEEVIDTPLPPAEDIAHAIPEALETLIVDETIPKNEAKEEELKVIRTSDLKPAHELKKPPKPHNPEEDVIITTADFKPRKWGKVPKL